MLKYDKIVIGATLSSVLHSFYQNIPIIFVEHKNGHPFDFFDSSIELSLLKMEPSKYELKKADAQDITFGIPKQKVYDKVLSILSMGGLVPFSNLVKSLWIEDDYIKVVTKGNKIFLVEYNELIIFDDAKINGIPVSFTEKVCKQQVIDWFDVNLGCVHDIDYIKTNDDFVREIFFYNSYRHGRNKKKKDLISISYLTADNAIYDYQYSDTYAKFKILKCMKDAGIRGPKNGKNPNYPNASSEPFKWLSPKITAVKREILPPSMPVYQNTETLHFLYNTPEEIVKNAQYNIDTYTFKLLNIL